MAQRIIMANGESVKSINPFDTNSRPEAWNWFSGAPTALQNEYYAKVAAMYAALNIRAETISSIPFVLLDKKGNEVDNTAHWENKVGFMPNPSELLRLNVMSYDVTNTIYILRTKDALGYKTKNLVHATPYNFLPYSKNNVDVDYITRNVGSLTEVYAYPEDDRLVRMWRLDHTTELLPSENTTAKAIASAAEIIYYADFWVGNFFRRGGIKPTLIAMKGLIDPSSKDDQEKSWSNWLRGVGKQFGNIARIFNSESIDPRTIGAGVDDLKDNGIYRQALENIAIGSRMPLSMFLSNSANYATAQVEKANWINNSILPFINWLSYEYNKQVFLPLGLRMEFRPEVVDGQDEEKIKTEVAKGYIGLIKESPTYEVFVGVAASAGLEITKDLDEAAKSYYQKAEKPEDTKFEEEKPEPKPKTKVEDAGVEVEENPTKWIPSLDELEEMRIWREVAIRRNKKSQSLDFEYEAHHGGLPEFVSLVIKSKLETCQNADDIKAVFDASFWYSPSDIDVKVTGDVNNDILLLADSLNKLAESIKSSG